MARYTKKPVDPSNLGTDPNSYTYVDGYGFTPPPPVITERRMLQFYANGLGFAVLFYFLLFSIAQIFWENVKTKLILWLQMRQGREERDKKRTPHL